MPVAIRHKQIRNSALLLILLAVFIGVAPRFLTLPALREGIISQLVKELGSEVRFTEMYWAWLPFPHLTLRKATLELPSAEISLPEAQIYPHWRILLGETNRLGRIHLVSPEIKIHGLPGYHISSKPFAFPQITVTIANGRLTLIAPDSSLPLKNETLDFSKIKASITSHSDRVTLQAQAASPFSRTLTIRGEMKPATLEYTLRGDIKDLVPDALLSSLAGGMVTPLDSPVSLKSVITGNVKEKRLSLALKGTAPHFLLHGRDGSFLVQGGEIDLTTDITGSEVSTVIRGLETQKPAMALRGEVVYQHPAPDADGEKPLPRWYINLSGRELDLTDIRRGLLTLWPENPVVSQVTTIVQNGKLESAWYQFLGTTEDFSHLTAMKIEADITDADIHVPEVDLDLTRARGPITIINGILAGQGLSASLGNNRGRNGKIFLGLTPSNHSFILDLDLDVDIEELQPVLNKVVANREFLAELAHFSEPSGRASGHLRLQERLDDISAEISVDSMNGKIHYDRTPWPLVIHGGKIMIDPARVAWEGVDALLGSHSVSGVSGQTTVTDPTFETLINSASLDGEKLLEELAAHALLPPALSDSITSLSGLLHLTDTRVRGSLFSPATWRYDLRLMSEKLDWTSPFFAGEKPQTRAAAALFRNGEVIIEMSENDLFGKTFVIDGKLKHTRFARWEGGLRFNGEISETIHSWLLSHRLLPDSLPLKLPLTLQDMTVTWDGHTTSASGGIYAHTSPGETRALIDITATGDSVKIADLQLTSGADRGVLTAAFSPGNPRHITFSWDGSVSAATINSLVETKILSGTMSGAFQATLTPSPDTTRIEGPLTVRDFTWARHDTALPELTVHTLDLLGSGLTTSLNRFEFTLEEETATLSGPVTPLSTGLTFDLALHAATINGNRLLTFWENARKKWPETTTSRLNGKIRFAVDTLLWSPRPRAPEQDSPARAARVYRISPATGELSRTPEQPMTLKLTSFGLCGIDISGQLQDNPEIAETYTISTPSGGALFQEVLPCLGFDQDVIEGNFTVNADLVRLKNSWQGTSASIHSENGTILRMNFLSKVLKVVNITDMFSSPGDTTAKGLSYSTLDINTTVQDDTLIIDKGVIRGQGINLFGKGNINLATLDSDLIILIAPLKTLDAIMAKVPLVGRIIGGENATVVTFPVGVEGNIRDPRMYVLPPEAIGDAVIGMVKETFMLPMRILSPILPKGKKTPPP